MLATYLSLCLAASPLAEDILWYPTYADALVTSVALDRPVFIYFTQDACVPCAKMSLELSEKSVIRAINTRFAALRYHNADAATLKAFGVESLPAVALISNGKRYDYKGYMDRTQLIVMCNVRLMTHYSSPCGIGNCLCGCRDGKPCTCRVLVQPTYYQPQQVCVGGH